MPDRALVLSYIESYAARDVAPFVKSLRATGFSGDIVFFTSNVGDDCRDLFAAHDVRQIPVARLDLKKHIRVSPWLARVLGMSSNVFVPDRSINMRLSALLRRFRLGETRFAWTVAKHLWHCQSGRFFYFQEFLRAHPEYASVLVTDARDVVFQRDPFAFDMDDYLYVFEEYAGKPLGQQRDNAGWIEALYGTAVLESLSACPVICVGLLLGRRRQVLQCIRKMTPEIITNYIGWGTDQGIPNYLIRSGQLPRAKVVPFGSGPAMHVGIAPRDSITVSDQGRVLNRDGDVCNIVHQYDRHADLKEMLLAPLEEDETLGVPAT